MDRETLYDLRALLALYPYYQTARLLMLKTYTCSTIPASMKNFAEQPSISPTAKSSSR